MKEKKTSILIVSLPGVSERMLKQVFCEKKDVSVIGNAEGGLSALNLIKKKHPMVVVINSNLPENESAELIHAIQSQKVPPISIVLVETSQQLFHAHLTNADFVVRSYELPSRTDSLMQEVRKKINKQANTLPTLENSKGG